jgi:hypothetical protein
VRPRLLSAAALLVLFTALAIAWTWPLAAHLRSTWLQTTPGPHPLALADQHLVAWILAWGAHALRTAPLRLLDANILHPLPQPLLLSEHLLAGALLVLPADVLFRDPVLDHNLLLVASFALGGTGTTLLAREVGVSWLAAVVAGILFAFGPLRYAQLGHVQNLSTHWMPFALLFAWRFLAAGHRADGLAFAACLALQALSSVYHAYYFGIAVGLFLLLHRLLRLPAAPGAYPRILALCALAALPLAPFMLAYARYRDRLGLSRAPWETFLYSACVEHWIGVFLHPFAYVTERYREGKPVLPLLGFGGWLLIALAAWGGIAGWIGRRRTLALWFGLALGMMLVSLGPYVVAPTYKRILFPGPHALLEKVIPGLDALRGPARAAAPALLAFAIVAAFGIDAARFRLRRPGVRLAAGVVLALLVGAEVWRPPLHVIPAPALRARPAVYAWLAAQPGPGAVVDLPFGAPLADARAMVYSTASWRPLVNGYSGFAPATTWLRSVLARFPDADTLRTLGDLGVRWVVVHPAEVPPAQAALCAAPPAPLRLAYRNAGTCALEFDAPPPPAPARLIRLPADTVLRATSSGGGGAASDGGDATAAADGRLDTRWTQTVDPEHDRWLELTLTRAVPVEQLVLRLGPNFGDRPRALRVEASDDGRAWRTLVDQPIVPAPLAALARTPDDVAVAVPLPGVATRHLRLVVPAARAGDPWDLRPGWQQWGLREVELWVRPEAAPSP